MAGASESETRTSLYLWLCSSLGQEAPFILYSTSAKQRGAQARNKDAGGGPCREYYGKKRLVFVFFFLMTKYV